MINAAAVLMNLPSPSGFFGISDNGKLNSGGGLVGSCVGPASGSSLENDMTRERRGFTVVCVWLPLPLLPEDTDAEREK